MLSPPVSPVCGGQPPVPSPEPVHSLGRTSLARSLTGARSHLPFLSFGVCLFVLCVYRTRVTHTRARARAHTHTHTHTHGYSCSSARMYTLLRISLLSQRSTLAL